MALRTRVKGEHGGGLTQYGTIQLLRHGVPPVPVQQVLDALFPERVLVRDQREDLVQLPRHVAPGVVGELGPQLLAVLERLLQQLADGGEVVLHRLVLVHLHVLVFGSGLGRSPLEVVLGVLPDHLDELAAPQTEVDLLVDREDLGVVRIGEFEGLVDVALEDGPAYFCGMSAMYLT